MAYDYKNPSPPQRGDGTYNGKFPNTYQVIDCIREHYYDIFKSDLALNGQSSKSIYQAVELGIDTYAHTARKFGSTFEKWLKTVFTIYLEKGNLNNPDNIIDFEFHRLIFEQNNEKDVLEFIKRCILDITGRNINIVLSDNYIIKFIHYPYERKDGGYDIYLQNDETIKTTKAVNYFINEYSGNRMKGNSIFYMSMISDDIVKVMNDDERKFIEESLISLYGWNKDKEIEVGKNLEYIKIKK